MTVYDFSAKTITGEDKSLKDYKGKALLIVNVASKCGFTPQYKGLQEVYDKYKDQGLEILGFPCNQFGGQEPGTEADITSFCELNYGVNFPMFAKVDVKGDKAHPLYTYMTEQAPGLLGMKAVKWNFTKFLIGKDGKVVGRFAPQTKPVDLEVEIEKVLGE
ncbi:glutathione peroxidase [Bacillus toyonensis]|uniref:glutathione peroxidase n=1 Tax=Bacillus cereus group TaxID=86661 RepID=UPI00028AA64C|nr:MULTISPECIES: glutathione peroxidase [Bacillus cereus group]OTW85364.1 glutathione peroxidase [Bacillus thuringiensis serovar cameroun]OTX01355.1 glutathione peroxidase [Bacillus thuringiensis serovar seoulensis]OTX40591.1 glutathione peroxidase [Bacillus thuringiensis serovar malayensis]OUB05010.1 glutathione peroxidase [Bacillus thuringiensis serovar shandongiensis]QPW48883.1 glutathione peroxidase [Bacillus thuringiensis]